MGRVSPFGPIAAPTPHSPTAGFSADQRGPLACLTSRVLSLRRGDRTSSGRKISPRATHCLVDPLAQIRQPTCDFSVVGGELARFLWCGRGSNPSLWYKSPIGPRLLLNHLASSPEKPRHREREGHEREGGSFAAGLRSSETTREARLVRDARHQA